MLTTATFGLATMRTASPVEGTTAPDTTASGHATMLTTSPITHSVEDTPAACVWPSQSFTPTTWPSSALPANPSFQFFCSSPSPLKR